MNRENSLVRFGRYEIIKELGYGNMGVVYLCRDPYIKREIAVKTANPRAGKHADKVSETFKQQFFHEAQSAGRLTHPNIVAVYDADIADDTCYIAMEYVDGPTVKEFCCKDELLPIHKAVEIIFSACKALDYAHNMDVIHRDIKPSNIMLNSDGAVKIGDFGIAMITGGTMTLGFAGTPHYMSPEQIEELPLDGRSDMFSLGCVLYELLTGEKAFPGKNPVQIINKIVNREPVPVSKIRPDVPDALEKIVLRALRKEPDERYQSCVDFGYELRVVLRLLQNSPSDENSESVDDYFCNLPFFASFTLEQIKTVKSASVVCRHEKDDVIVSQGEVDDSLFVVLSGKGAVMKDGRKITVLEKGECFGEMAYLSGQPRDATVIAETDCVLMKVSATLMDKAPDSLHLLFLKTFAMTLVRRLSKSNRIITDLMEKQ